MKSAAALLVVCVGIVVCEAFGALALALLAVGLGDAAGRANRIAHLAVYASRNLAMRLDGRAP